MRIVAISDTHNSHPRITIPECDILIHAGDESFRGSQQEIELFAEWFDEQPAKHLVWTPGNHSLGFEAAYPQSRDWVSKKSPRTHILMQSTVTIEGIKIWGSPVTPRFFDWAFNVDRGDPIYEYWEMIPADTNIVVTHGPPYGILDQVPGRKHGRIDWDIANQVGCFDLARVIRKIKPKMHIFGHIHESRGVEQRDGTTYVNASIMDGNYVDAREPMVFTYENLP